MLKKIFLGLSLVLTVLISFLMKITLWKEIWIPIVLFIGIYIGVVILYFFIIWLLSLTIDTKKEYDKPNKFYAWLVVITMEMLSNYARAKVKVTGMEKIPTNQKYMLVFNHRSKFDPIIQSYILRKSNLVHISKPSNFKAPIAGPFIKRSCYLSIDRDNARNGLKTIIKAINLIENDVASVGVSPEGTRNYGDGLLPFHNGCFKIALKAKCPIVISTMHGTSNIHKNFPWKRTKVEMKILKVLTYDEIKDLSTNEISNMVRTIMKEDLGIKEEENELYSMQSEI